MTNMQVPDNFQNHNQVVMLIDNDNVAKAVLETALQDKIDAVINPLISLLGQTQQAMHASEIRQ